MKNWPRYKLRGKTETVEVAFPSLRGNPLRDPYRRQVVTYLPPGYGQGKKKFPYIVTLSGYLGSGLSFLNHDALSFNLIERVDRMIAGGAPPFVLVCPDGFTRYGGSQFVNSGATGNYEWMIARDLVRWIEKNLGVSRGGGIAGHSSGGYGAITIAMKNPGVFRAAACHAGDMYFELCYKPDFPRAAETLAAHGAAKKFLAALDKKEKLSSGDVLTLNALAMASCYSPNPKSPDGFDLPFQIRTAELREEVWKRWLNHDPVNLVKRYGKNLKSLKLLFIDCGSRDEHFLHFGSRILSERLKAAGIRHVYEEFPDGHRGTGYRYAVSLPLMAKALARS